MQSKLNLSRLNQAQREAVLHGDGPLLILAGAGSGKTSTMTHRIAYLILDRGVSPKNILGLSFTNKAANELKERVQTMVQKQLGAKSTEGLIVSTFHSLCVKILREFGHLIGFSRDFTILDSGDQQDILRQILKTIKIDDRKFDPAWLLSQMSFAKNRMLSGEAAENYFLQQKGPKVAYDDYSIALVSSFPKYMEKLRSLNAMDFDDLIANTVRLLDSNPEVRTTLSQRFQHILVDEYQDTNPAQFKILELLTCTHKNLCVVGDDDQSIYAWRGADPSHILEFKNHFPTAKVLVLDKNYRSTEIIIEAANSVIAKNSKRYPKQLVSTRGRGEPVHAVVAEEDRLESEMVSNFIFEMKSGTERKYSDFAILYRSNSQSRIFEESLRAQQIPYKLIGAMSFLDRKEIKDILSYLRLILNPRDDASCRRILNWPARGLGKGALDKINTSALHSGDPIIASLRTPPEDLGPRAKQSCLDLVTKIEKFRDELLALPPTPHALSQWTLQVFESLAIREALLAEEEEPANAEKKWESILELANAMGMMRKEEDAQSASDLLQSYLAKLTLDSKEDRDSKEQKDAVTLMTLHSAKGLEFPVVFLVGLEDGILPHQRTIDEKGDLSEERRLFYVGLTRAKDQLFLLRCKNRIRYGKQIPRNPSRFLQDLPRDLILDRSAEAREKQRDDVLNHLEELRKKLLGDKAGPERIV